MIYQATEITKLTFRVNPPLFLPFYNKWGKNVYHTTEPFSHNPFTIGASSTSGSPVVITENKFFGFLNESGGEFAFNGSDTLTVTLCPGQELYYDESCNTYEEWEKYNKIIRQGQEYKPEPFWSALEYCTWVEQAKVWALCDRDQRDVLDEQFVYDYMEKVKKLGLPKGKLTIDDGWAINATEDGAYSVGNWEINRTKFPNFEKLVQDMKSEGFIPGLWFSPFTLTPDSELAKAHPEIVGTPYSLACNWYNMKCDEEILRPYYRELFGKYAAMGFMKFKLDISYGPKDDMIKLLKIMYEEIKAVNPHIEVETHIPDIFATRYADTVRINDVAYDNDGAWRYITSGHYVVCKNSSSDRILNLDHIGTNNPLITGRAFIEHCDMLLGYAKESGGYPTISYLPDMFGDEIKAEFAEKINGMYDENGFRRADI